MDDRNFWSPDVDQVIQRILRWQQWSKKMGLRENPMKTQVTSKTPRDYEVLLGKAPQWAKPEIKLLGVTTKTCRRSNSDSENLRIFQSMQRARALYTLPLKWEQRVKAYQSFVLSKAAYRWIGHNPELNQANKLFTLLSTSLKQQRMGSRELKKICFGVHTYLPIVFTTRRYARVARNLHRSNPPKWLTTAFCSGSILRKELRDLGFSEISPWFWKMDQPWRDLVKADEKVLGLRTNHQPVLGVSKILSITPKGGIVSSCVKLWAWMNLFKLLPVLTW